MAGRNGRHLTAEEWKGFVSGKLDRRVARRGVRHLLARCEECQLLAANAFLGAPGLLLEIEAREDITRTRYVSELVAMLRSVPERQLHHAAEKVLASGKIASLLVLAPGERRDAIIADPYFQTLGLYERLLEVSRWAHRHDVKQSLELAELALVVAEHLDPDEYAADLRSDYQVSALAHVANANRIAGNIMQAEAMLLLAWKRLADGTGDPKEEALLHRHQADLHLELRQLEEASTSYSRAFDIYVRIDDLHMQGRTLVQQSVALGYVEPERGLALAEVALTLLDGELEPRAVLCARHQIIFCLNELGRAEEAAVLLETSRKLYKQFGDPPTMALLHWVEARINRTKGNAYEAELVLRQIWEQFEKDQRPIDLTLVTLDLVEVLVAQGKTAAAIDFCDAFYPALRDFHMHREGLAMWLLLRKAVSEQTIKYNRFRELGPYFYRSWREPSEQVH
jgi:tetratricopeptide (TPR) repeat protein